MFFGWIVGFSMVDEVMDGVLGNIGFLFLSSVFMVIF